MIRDRRGQAGAAFGLGSALLSASMLFRVDTITALFRPAAVQRAPVVRGHVLSHDLSHTLPTPHFGHIPTHHLLGALGPFPARSNHLTIQKKRKTRILGSHLVSKKMDQTLEIISAKTDFTTAFAPYLVVLPSLDALPQLAPDAPDMAGAAPGAQLAMADAPIIAAPEPLTAAHLAEPEPAAPAAQPSPQIRPQPRSLAKLAKPPKPIPASAATPISAPVSATLVAAALGLPAAHGLIAAPPGPAALPAIALSDPGRSLTSPLASSAGIAPKFTSDDALILQIESADGALADTVDAYGTRAGVFLPLGAVTRLLDLAIKISDDGHFASGWVLAEKQTLSVDLRQNQLRVGGKETALAPGDAAALDGELYLRAERFADLFPLSLKVDLHAQTVVIKTTVPFPYEARQSRENDRARLDNKLTQNTTRRWPRETTPYAAISFPIADLELRLASDKAQGPRIETDVRLAGDIGLMTGQLYLNSTSKEGLTAARIELGRRDPFAQLLGPLKATEFQIGDVAQGSLPLGLRGASGRGATITNVPLEHASVFDKIDFRGILLDGYEVELYRNNILLASTRAPVNGQYEFLQVPVDFGLNLFRFVFYGPQGQKREEVRQISVGDGRLSKGQFFYTVSAIQKNTTVFKLASKTFIPSPDFGRLRTTAEVQYGLSSGVTTILSGAWYETASGPQWLIAGGLRSGLAGLALKLDAGYQSGGGKALELGLGGRIFGFGYTASHAEYSGGFIDEVRAQSDQPLRRASELDINGALHFGGGLHGFTLPISARYRRIETPGGLIQSDASLRTSARVAGYLLSNTLDYSRTSEPGTPPASSFTGNFDLASLRSAKTHYRASLGYQITPGFALTNVSADIDHAFDERTLVQASVSHVLASHETQFGLSASRRFSHFTTALDASYGIPSGGYNVVLRLGLSFGRNPQNKGFFFQPPGLASGGALALHAFRDDNANHRFDPGEAELADVSFETSSQIAKTDKHGLAFIGNIGNGNRTSVQLDTETLPDIDLAPLSRGIEIVPRPGRIHVSEFAVQVLGSIEGTAFFAGEGTQRAVSSVVLRLIGPDGKLAGHARTEADGYYLFEQVLPGTYAVELDAGQAARLNLALAEPVTVSISPKANQIRQKILIRAGIER